MINVGDIAPGFALSGSKREKLDLGDVAIAGRFILLMFASAEGVAEMDRHAATFATVRECGGRAYAILVGTAKQDNGTSKLPVPVLLDSDGAVSAAYGIDSATAGPIAVFLAPNRHVSAVCSNPDTIESEIADVVVRSRSQWQARPCDPHPPVLTVPDVLSPADCQRLISVYRLQGNVFVDPGHGETGMRDDYKMKIPEFGRGDRTDHFIVNPETNRLIDDRLQKRLFPEIHTAFQYRITRREHFRIGCYEGERGGDLNGHRDNTEPRVAHRRFAVSINLNTEAFAGGEIQFLEYGGHRYRLESGAAFVFSSSLLHEILEVSEGRRYVLLAFLYGET